MGREANHRARQGERRPRQARVRARTLNPGQLAALASPVRIAVFESLRESPANVAELAARLGRSPHSLYYHLRALDRVDLVRGDLRHPAGGRPEAVYSVPHPRLRLSRVETGRAYRASATRVVASGLRRALREHASAQEAIARGELAATEIAVLRLRARLTGKSADTVRRRVRELSDWIRRHESSRGRLVSITVLATPVVDVKRRKTL